jgi:hypothetical protein
MTACFQGDSVATEKKRTMELVLLASRTPAKPDEDLLYAEWE